VARSGQPVVLWSTSPSVVDEMNRERQNRSRLPGVELSAALHATGQAAELAARARLIVVAVSSADVGDRAAVLGPLLDGRHLLVHAIGASAGPDDRRVSELLRDETPVRRIGTLAGPALTADLVAGRFAAMVCASPFDEVTREARRLLNLPPGLRLYTSRDLVGVELAASLSGAYTVALGMADSLEMGPGPRAVLITRVVAEAQRLVAALGGEARSFAGLAGLGNLLLRTAPGASENAPGTVYGRALAKGRVPEGRVPDPVRAVGASVRLARKFDLHLPVLDAVSRVIDGEWTARRAASALADTVGMEE
jgi:glycerol-3-phosphate dehydrogenase (NAD(P)+)